MKGISKLNGTSCVELAPYDYPLVVCIQYIYNFLPFYNIACSEVVIEFEWRATYSSSWRVKLRLAPLSMPKWVWPSMNQCRMFCIQTPTLPPIMHQQLNQTWKVLYANQPNSGPKVMLSYKITLLRPIPWDNQYQYNLFRDETSHNSIVLGLFLLLSGASKAGHILSTSVIRLYFSWILCTVFPVTLLRTIRFLFELTHTTKLLHQILVMQWLWCCLDSMRKFPKENAEILLYIFPHGQQLLRPYQVSHAYDLILLPLLWDFGYAQVTYSRLSLIASYQSAANR